MDSDQITSAEPQSLPPITVTVPTPAKKGKGWRIFWGIFTGLSVLVNIILLLVIIGMGVMLAGEFGSLTAGGGGGGFSEELLLAGSRTQKIAVINIGGIIENEMADAVTRQVRLAGEDRKVKAVIVKIDSPGGTVAASDRINYELGKLRKDYHKPTVAFIQGMAASGGYYSAVACDRIVAEPAAITGSIGVIMETFTFQQLLEEKLGIQPVVLKSGEKKDWPNMFKPVTEEQKAYLQDKLIRPAYERFVKVVAAGRPMLSEEQVRTLADGSIYNADEAADAMLVDDTGYFEKAVEIAQMLGNAKGAEVVEYRRVFSWASWLDARSGITLPSISRKNLTEFSQPQLLYLWK
ncbi:MAG: signal peptide peptidase SppA [Sedimentisphaerales bacterium]|nr:signal peptide peptidase SppA [Sedimentisphaerales bacterium]